MHTVNLDWNAIDTVLLDMDGTLLDLHFDNYFWLTHLPLRYAAIHNVSEADAREYLMSCIKDQEGTLNWYCLEYWSKTLKLDVRALKDEIKHKIQVRPHVAAFLQLLKAAKKKVILITNAHPQSLSLKLEVTALDKWLDIIISSHEFKEPKEAQAFWYELVRKEKFKPQKALFIDDTVRILDSARTFGIGHLLCIHQPDSQTHRRIDAYPSIDHFDELFTGLNAAGASGG
ncbi:GMP/IMP nucleotidase [Simiduia litorea]|uniref:GMP/IMP nucleotidase n=1 Tax=Simiduia litorea TaxID=1435348 RepID=UPI0036F32010